MGNNEIYDCLWPGGPNVVDQISLAPRSDLAGKRIGFLWNNVFRGDEIFPILETKISERYDKVEFIAYGEFCSTFGANELNTLTNLPKRLKELKIDAVISGVGC